MRINVNKDTLTSHSMKIKKITFFFNKRIKYLFLETNVPCVYLLYFTDLHLFFKGLIYNQGVFKYTIYNIAMLLKILNLL